MRRIVAATAAAAALLAGCLVGLSAPSSAEAATGQSCSYANAGSGTYANTICWLDLSAYSATEATSAAGQSLSYSIPGGYTLSFTLKVSGIRGAQASSLPTYNQAYLGQNGHYTGVAGRPALYTNAGSNSGDATASQTNVTMTDSTGRAVDGWSLVGADAESTDVGESITWNSSAPIASLTTTPGGGSGLGNACGGGFTGVGTASVTCEASSQGVGTKTGTAIVASTSPTSFSQVMHLSSSTSLQAVAFGVQVSKLTLNKDVAGRITAGDSFDTSITSPEGTAVGSATTGTAATSTTGTQTVLPRANGSGIYTMAEKASTGSTTLALYGQSWTCTNTVTTSPTPLPTGSGTSQQINPAPGDDITCTITNTPASYTVEKTSSSTNAAPGDMVTYTVTVKNTGPVAYTTANPASFTDDLSKVTDDATYVDGSATGGATVDGDTLTWSGPLAIGATQTITYQVKVNNPDTGDKTLTNAVTPTGPGGTCATGGDCQTTTPVRTYTVEKTASAESANPGDKVTYTVTVKNTGTAAYTADNPASFTDDLSKVLDDATYNDDATGGATLDGTTLSWSGPLAVGATQTITYSVTVDNPDTGDHVLTNAVVPTAPGGDCATADGCETTTPVRSLQIVKKADQSDVVPGSTVTYTITVKNTGQVAYTATDPATFTDSLSKVLDDATYNDDADASAGTVSYDEPTLSWSGPVPVGDTVTITYSVTVNTPDTGDKHLDNTVVSDTPGNNCPTDSTDPNCLVEIPAGTYTVQKTASTDTVNPGDTITYTVTVQNTGQVAYTTEKPASFTDDLSKVTDDATYVDGSATGGATVDGDTLTWSGPLAIGATQTITYQVQVNSPDTGDKTITNTVRPTGPGGSCTTAGDCTTTALVHGFTVQKTASETVLTPGDTITYTVTVKNTGTAAYTADNPASFTDDLSKVTDDATYVDGSASNGATVDGNTLTWSGPLAVGATETITYKFTVNSPDTGDKTLTNAVVPTAPGGDCATADGCETTTPVRTYTVNKVASEQTATPGSKVTYTVTVQNTGTAAYTTDAPASFTDDLSKVLDDATYNGDAVSNSDGTADTGEVTFASPKLSWTGPLAVGGTVTVTYTVTVNNPDRGDHILTNAVDPTGPGGDCSTPGGCETTTPVQSIAFTKTADTTEVVPGATVTYTITAKNTGQVAYTDEKPATFTDSLSKVLDDATYNSDASATAGTVSYREPTLSWSGPVEIGQTVTITYSVTVNRPDTGDKHMDNTVVSDTPGNNCPADAGDPDCTANLPSGSYTVHKTASTKTATQGSTIRYTVTVTNTGTVPYTNAAPASFRDNMTKVLDDASYNRDAKASAGTVSYAAPNLAWSGPLPVDGSVTVTYTVTVHTPDTGDRTITNAVIPTGAGGSCTTAAACTTTANVPPGFTVHTGGSATTAGMSGWEAGVTALSIAALFGSAAMGFRRRNIKG